ncbi:MAG: OsmC family protein [Planctomycetota bacterium]
MSTTQTRLNGIDVDALRGAIQAVGEEPDRGQTRWQVCTTWQGGTRMDTRVSGYWIGGTYVAKDFTIPIDEPLELCGSNLYANPQEYLFAALNSCMMVGFVAICSLEGIRLEELRIETDGDIDLRGFFGLSREVKPGYDEIRFTVHAKGDASHEDFRRVHEAALATSPNYFNVANPIRLTSDLQIID